MFNSLHMILKFNINIYIRLLVSGGQVDVHFK